MAENHISTLTFIEKFINSPDRLGDIVYELIGGHRLFPVNFLRNAEAEDIFREMERRPFSDYYRFARAYMHKLHPWWWERQANSLFLGGIAFRVINGRIERHFREKFSGFRDLFAREPGQKNARQVRRAFKSAAASQKALNRYYMKDLLSLKAIILAMLDADGPFMPIKFYDFILYDIDEDEAEVFRSLEVGMKNIREILKNDRAANLDMITGLFRKFQQAYGGENGSLFIERMSWDGLLMEYSGDLKKLMGGDAARGAPPPGAAREPKETGADGEAAQPEGPGTGPGPGEPAPKEGKKPADFSDPRHITAYAALVKETCLDVLDDADVKKIRAVLSGMYGKNIQFIGEEASGKMVKEITSAWLEDESISDAKKTALRDAYDAVCGTAGAPPRGEEPERIEVTILEEADDEYPDVSGARGQEETGAARPLKREAEPREEPGGFGAGNGTDAEEGSFDIQEPSGKEQPGRFAAGERADAEAEGFDIAGAAGTEEPGRFSIAEGTRGEAGHFDIKDEQPADAGEFETGASSGSDAGRYKPGAGGEKETGKFDIRELPQEEAGHFAIGDEKGAGTGSFEAAPAGGGEDQGHFTAAAPKDVEEAGTFAVSEAGAVPEGGRFGITDTSPEKLAGYFLDIRDWSQDENRAFLGELVSASLKNKPVTVLKFFEQLINSGNVDPLVKNAVIEGYGIASKSALLGHFYVLNKSIQGESDPAGRVRIISDFREKISDHHMAALLHGLLDAKLKSIERESSLRLNENRVFEELKNTQGDRSGMLGTVRNNKSLSPAFRNVAMNVYGARDFDRIFLEITSSNISPGQKISFLLELRSLALNVYQWINDDENDRESASRKKRIDDKIIFYTNIVANIREEHARFKARRASPDEARPQASPGARKRPPKEAAAPEPFTKDERLLETAASIITSFHELPEKMGPLVESLKKLVSGDIGRKIDEELVNSKRKKDMLINETVKMIQSKKPNPEVLRLVQSSTPLFQFIWGGEVAHRLKAKSLDEAFSVFAAEKEFHKDAQRIARVIGINNASGILESSLKSEEKLLEQISAGLTAENLKRLWHAVRSGRHKDKVKLFREFLDIAGGGPAK